MCGDLWTHLRRKLIADSRLLSWAYAAPPSIDGDGLMSVPEDPAGMVSAREQEKIRALCIASYGL